MAEKIYIFDTTLRDGEQSAGVAFTPKEKLEIAKQLERIGVDVIEAGFPISSPGDMAAVKTISKEVRGTSICALARAVPADIDAAWEGICEAADPRIHVFINTSAIQIEHQLRMDPATVLDQAVSMVRYATKFTSNVEFSPMDATRTDPQFLYSIIEACINAGATTINVPDSVGYAIPEEFGTYFRDIFKNVSNIHRARVSVHAHNDLGLCSANTLSAIQNGVRQAEVTVNGIGERAGNTSLEEVAMAIRTRKDFLNYYTDINHKEIYRTSKLIETCSGMPIQWNKAIVGKNSFRHGSGMHWDEMSHQDETRGRIDPEAIGVPQGAQIIISKLSGRQAFRDKVAYLGFELTDEELERAFDAVQALSDKKANIDDRDIEAILIDQMRDLENPAWTLDHIQVSAGNNTTATATLTLRDPTGAIVKDAATGTGPIDAVYQAMNRITGIVPTLTEFSIKAITEGIDAQGEVTIRIEDEKGNMFIGRASETDIIVASARAYTKALNRLIYSTRPSRYPVVNADGP
ncbi:MAG: 2-isopropylmalate synthase [Myxococcota bacterium]|nr:2-isopropylmalate synthase [Myxococcota bacterium]